MITALGNDFGYGILFFHKLLVLANYRGVLVGISASGNSPNLNKAFYNTKLTDIKAFALTAFYGCKLKQIADDDISVSMEPGLYWTAEDTQMILDHLIGAYLISHLREGR